MRVPLGSQIAPRRSRLQRYGILVLTLGAAAPALLGSCSRRPAPGTAGHQGLREGSSVYVGTYLLRPSNSGARLELQSDGTATLWVEGVRHRGAFQVTSQSLRVFVTPETGRPQRTAPIGVFLVADYDSAGWRGLWDGDVTFLVRGGTERTLSSTPDAPGGPPSPRSPASGSDSGSPGPQRP